MSNNVFVVYAYSPGGGVSIDGLDVIVGVFKTWDKAVKCIENITGTKLEDCEDEIQVQPDLYMTIMSFTPQ